MPGSVKGMLVGFANTLVVAFCIAMISDGKEATGLMILIVTMACIPATMTGALLGHLAAELKRMNRAIVLVIMIAVSCLAVAALGDMFDLEELVFVSCIPTAAACSVLERWTRAKPDEPIPLARVA